jgi:hypothetical protein
MPPKKEKTMSIRHVLYSDEASFPQSGVSGQVLTCMNPFPAEWANAAVSNSLSVVTAPLNYTGSGPTTTQIGFTQTGPGVAVAMPAIEVTQTGASTLVVGSFPIPTNCNLSNLYNSAFSTGQLYFPALWSDNGTSTLGQWEFHFQGGNLTLTAGGGTSGNTFSGSGLLVSFPTSFTYTNNL